jgi:uncharacterized membrane protein YdjX (TVP38/TMEM64 family)
LPSQFVLGVSLVFGLLLDVTAQETKKEMTVKERLRAARLSFILSNIVLTYAFVPASLAILLPSPHTLS